MDENAANRKTDDKRWTQALPAPFTLTAVLVRGGREARRSLSTKGRLECLPVAMAEAQARVGRWNA